MVKHGTERAALETSRMCLMTSSMRRFTLHNRNILHHKSMWHVAYIHSVRWAEGSTGYQFRLAFSCRLVILHTTNFLQRNPSWYHSWKLFFYLRFAPAILYPILRRKITLNDWHCHPHFVRQFSVYRNEILRYNVSMLEYAVLESISGTEF